MNKFLKENGTLIALILLIIIMTVIDIYMSDGSTFLTSRNLTNLIRQVAVIGIIAVGMTAVILIGGIDLSVGSIVGVSAVTVSLIMQKWELNAPFAILLTLLTTGVLTGLWNGFLISKYKIPPFIITLGMMTIARGLAHIFFQFQFL